MDTLGKSETIPGTNIPLSGFDKFWAEFLKCKCGAEEGKPCFDQRFVGKRFKSTPHTGRQNKKGEKWRR